MSSVVECAADVFEVLDVEGKRSGLLKSRHMPEVSSMPLEAVGVPIVPEVEAVEAAEAVRALSGLISLTRGIILAAAPDVALASVASIPVSVRALPVA